MESFTEKVEYGGRIHFDTMLDFKKGWISREALKHDVEMVDTVIEVMEEASQRTFKDGLTTFRAQSGEVLPSKIERNISGFLVRKDDVSFKVESQKLFACIALLQDQLVIAKFVGPKPNSRGFGDVAPNPKP